jgi:adenylylsulfate kinase-like enzyme
VGRLAVETLRAEGHRCAVLDADELAAHLRHGPDDDGIAALAWLVGLLADAGVVVVVTADLPRRADRLAFAGLVPGLVEVHVDATPDVCAARAGVEDRGYEAPIGTDRRVPTDDRDPRASAALLVAHVESLLT